MSTCTFTGNTDMYGLGIRIGFYLQWFGTILALWVARGEVQGMRLSNSLFVAATFLALIIQTAKDNLKPVEIYIILLLTFGGYLYFVPLYIWRLLTGCAPEWDPSRYPLVNAGKVFSALNFLLLVSVSIFQLWFWISKVNSVGSDGCEEYGFFFAKLRLNEKGFVVANILFHFFLLLCCLVILCITIGKKLKILEEKESKRIGRVRLLALRELQTFVNLAVASTVVAATEFTIQWNGINGVGDLNSAGQLIPMLIGVGLVTRVVYIGIIKGDNDDDDSDDGSSSDSDDWPGRLASLDGISYVEPPPTSQGRPGNDHVLTEVYHLPYRHQQTLNTFPPELDSLGTPRPPRSRRR